MFKNDDTCLEKTQPKEPIFVLCARDRLAPHVVQDWIDRADEHGVPFPKTEDARRVKELMEDWQRENPDQVKDPD